MYNGGRLYFGGVHNKEILCWGEVCRFIYVHQDGRIGLERNQVHSMLFILPIQIRQFFAVLFVYRQVLV